MTKNKINTGNRTRDRLSRLGSMIYEGAREVVIPSPLNPHCRSFPIKNFRWGLESYKFDVCEAKIAESAQLESDHWRYGKVNAQFRKTDFAHVVLAMPQNYSSKYIRAFTIPGVEVVISLPGINEHYELRNAYEELTGESLQEGISGGYIKQGNGMLILYGQSIKYGEADHKSVANLLNRLGLPAEFEETKRT
jgi:hypothetical protein